MILGPASTGRRFFGLRPLWTPQVCGYTADLGKSGALRPNRSALFLENGAIAQLGERFNGIEEVVGSIPSGSTKDCQALR